MQVEKQHAWITLRKLPALRYWMYMSVLIYVIKQLLVLTKLTVKLEELSFPRLMRKEQRVVSQCAN